MRSPVCGLSDNANRLSHITVLFPLFRARAEGLLVIIRGSGEVGGASEREGKHGLSARSGADRHRTRTLPVVGRPAPFSRAQRVISVGDVLARIRQRLIFAGRVSPGTSDGIADASNENFINRVPRFDIYILLARQFCAIIGRSKNECRYKENSLIDLQIISLNKRLHYVLLMQR